ncbi:Phage-related baseplate assembly protein [Planctomycetes bacterium Pan216]|uniref:Phage-related baseplate assembly protein n=1 Tax=Kolteria novifilia TaxID=2527975 RepID=A0A518B399_9BACT|nr:Phage-related baseplate assembly protein [Planctomycetes bacterium Pan216]
MSSVETAQWIALTTPLGTDTFHVTRFEGREEISRLFVFKLDLLVDNATTIDVRDVVGRPASLRLRDIGAGERFFHGIIRSLRRRRRDATFTHYQAELVPACWPLARTRRSRIFQRKTVRQVLEVVLRGYDVAFELRADYEPREYRVQYQESDIDFVNRVLEEEGLYFYFRHTESAHQLVIADTSTQSATLPGLNPLPFRATQGESSIDPSVSEWEIVQDVATGRVSIADTAYGLTQRDVLASRVPERQIRVGTEDRPVLTWNDDIEATQYPGHFAQWYEQEGNGGVSLDGIFAESTRLVDHLLEADLMGSFWVDGRSNAVLLSPGFRFALTGDAPHDGEYFLRSVAHVATQPPPRAGGEEPSSYANSFRCIPVSLPFRQRRRTPRPTIAGVQTAIVVGPQGEEISTDTLGRVRVRFPWVREESGGAEESVSIRVAQLWAGQGWGANVIPRVGQEVVVAFEEGDPERPLIVGSVYNATQRPPFTLPEERTRMGIRSDSRGGDASNFSELRIEDASGREHVKLHSERDLFIDTERRREELVGERYWIGVGFPFPSGSSNGGFLSEPNDNSQTSAPASPLAPSTPPTTTPAAPATTGLDDPRVAFNSHPRPEAPTRYESDEDEVVTSSDLDPGPTIGHYSANGYYEEYVVGSRSEVTQGYTRQQYGLPDAITSREIVNHGPVVETINGNHLETIDGDYVSRVTGRREVMMEGESDLSVAMGARQAVTIGNNTVVNLGGFQLNNVGLITSLSIGVGLSITAQERNISMTARGLDCNLNADLLRTSVNVGLYEVSYQNTESSRRSDIKRETTVMTSYAVTAGTDLMLTSAALVKASAPVVLIDGMATVDITAGVLTLDGAAITLQSSAIALTAPTTITGATSITGAVNVTGASVFTGPVNVVGALTVNGKPVMTMG